MINDRAIVITERQLVCDLLNGAIFNDLEWPLTQIQGHATLTLNISETVRDRNVATMEQ